jgi:hypothetical protein
MFRSRRGGDGGAEGVLNQSPIWFNQLAWKGTKWKTTRRNGRPASHRGGGRGAVEVVDEIAVIDVPHLAR